MNQRVNPADLVASRSSLDLRAEQQRKVDEAACYLGSLLAEVKQSDGEAAYSEALDRTVLTMHVKASSICEAQHAQIGRAA